MTDTPSATEAAGRDEAANFSLDLARSQMCYVNFCRVTATPEELVLDLGLQTLDHAADPVWEAPQRISFNLYTAKRLLGALQATLQQFESTFGTVETDIEKRLVPPAK